MTTLRLLVLLLFAVLLPLRGTLAATQPCMGTGGGQGVAVAQAAPAGHDGAHHADHHAGHHQAPADDAGTSADADTGNHGTGCQASACCLMPLASTPTAMAALRLDNQQRFPALVTPEPAFQCGGQDRPPRHR